MKNHIIFWNRGKAITLALLVSLACITRATGSDIIGQQFIGYGGNAIDNATGETIQSISGNTFKQNSGVSIYNAHEGSTIEKIEGNTFENNTGVLINNINARIKQIGKNTFTDNSSNIICNDVEWDDQWVTHKGIIELITDIEVSGNKASVIYNRGGIIERFQNSTISNMQNKVYAIHNVWATKPEGSIVRNDKNNPGYMDVIDNVTFRNNIYGDIRNIANEIKTISNCHFIRNELSLDKSDNFAIKNYGAIIGDIIDCTFMGYDTLVIDNMYDNSTNRLTSTIKSISGTFEGNTNIEIRNSASTIEKIDASFTGGKSNAIQNINAYIGEINGTFAQYKNKNAIYNGVGIVESSEIDDPNRIYEKFVKDLFDKNDGYSIRKITGTFKDNTYGDILNETVESEDGRMTEDGRVASIKEISAKFIGKTEMDWTPRFEAIFNKAAFIGAIKKESSFTNYYCTDDRYIITNIDGYLVNNEDSQKYNIGSIEGKFENNRAACIFNRASTIGNIGDEEDGKIGKDGKRGDYHTTFNNNPLVEKAVILNTFDSVGGEKKEGYIGAINAQFKNNKIDKDGSVIYNNASKIGSIRGSFENNTHFYWAGGGAIRNISGAVIDEIDAIFIKNWGSEGGAIYNYVGPEDFNTPSIIKKIKGTFSFNGGVNDQVSGGSEGSATIAGGAIMNMSYEEKSMTKAVIEEIAADFDHNTAGQRGGAIYMNYLARIDKIAGGTYHANEAGDEGGAIHNGGTIREIIDAKYTQNISNAGGAIFNNGFIGEVLEGDVWVGGITGDSGVFKENVAESGGGGALFNNGTIISISVDSFEGNTAEWGGGAIYNTATISLGITANKMIDNHSNWMDDYGGGALYNKGYIYSLTIDECTGNEAQYNGGAIANWAGAIGKITINNLSNNTSVHGSQGGGAIFNGKGASLGEIEIQTLSYNSVGKWDSTDQPSGGGAIANYGQISYIKVGDAFGNRAWKHNGGVISNGTIEYDNTKAEILWGITGNSFHDNYAYGSGGAIHNEGVGANIQYIHVNEFVRNISRSSGGAIRNYKGAKIGEEQLSSNFVENYAWNRAGALYYEGTLTEGVFGKYEKNEAHSDGGAIVFAEDSTHIGTITAEFTQNRSGVCKDTLDKDGKKVEWFDWTDWTERVNESPMVANGGAILNGFRYIDTNTNRDGEYENLDQWFNEHKSQRGEQDGNEYYLVDSANGGSRIDMIKAQFTGNTAAYTEADKPSPVATGLGSGGAIANGYIDHIIIAEANPDDPSISDMRYDFWVVANGTIESIADSNFSENKAIYRGGAIYNARGRIGTIKDTRFTFNTAYRESGDGYGGAIFNNLSSTIETIRNVEFVGNIAGADGGAIYNEAVGVDGKMLLITDSTFESNHSGTGGSAIHNLGRIGTQPTDASGEHTGSITDGIVNTSFTSNTVEDGGLANAAVYTAGTLAFTATKTDTAGSYAMIFDGNKVGDTGLSRDLYVTLGADGEMPDIYMTAENASSITTNGEVLGEKGFILRLRGHLDRQTETAHARSGNINFNGLVINADVLMDDVTLKLGTAKATDYGRYSAKDKPYMDVYDDTIEHRKDGATLIPTGKPDGVEIDGSKGDVSTSAPEGRREYSDVLRMSRLEARSGQVHTADGQIVNYNIGTISSNGRMAYEPGNTGGYYDNKDLYAIWSIDVNLDTLKADTFTTWYKEGDDKKAQSEGYLTLSGCNITTATASNVGYDGYRNHEEHDHSGEVTDMVPTDKYPGIDDYYDVNIQVINLVKLDKDGKEMATPEEWKKAGNTAESAPLQLDLGKLMVKPVEDAYMSTDYLLCEGIGYGTTKTYHDSLRIWGWRDGLAAWAEWTKSGDPAIAGKEYGKEFEVIGGQTLTRNIKRGADGRLLQGDGLMIHGSVAGTTSVLNVNGFNLLSEVAKDQTLELRYLTIKNIGTSDDPKREGSVWNKTQVDGTLILDTLKFVNDAGKQEELNPAYTVVNDNEVIRRGDWDTYYTYTSHMSGQPGKAENGVTNVLRLQDGRTEITETGVVEHQNIINETDKAYTYLRVNYGTDERNGSNYTLWSDPETPQFRHFVDNSLTMQAGYFDLRNLNRSELILRDFNVYGGHLHVNTVTVDLSDKADIRKVPGTKVEGWKEGHMGMIWATESADQNLQGQIWVERVVLLPLDGEAMRIPVQFVNPEVGASVVPFNEEGDYGTPNEADNGHLVSKTYPNQHGAKYVYTVHYDYDMGQYIYERMLTDSGDPVFTPSVQQGPVAGLAGAFASMQQVNDYVFEHADLFSSSVYSTQQDRLRRDSFIPVEPTKGKAPAVGAAPAPTTCGGEAGFKGGMWVRPYSAFERLPLKNGPKVSNRLYGALVGGDTALKDHENGWLSVFSVHAAYMGSTQRYQQRGAGVRATQNGGGAGVTGTFYHKNFYTALTGTIATSSGHATSIAGSENFRTISAGIASRSGYNISFDKGRYILQPTLLASFTTVHTPTYTDAAGVRISSSALNVLQLHPYVKFIMNTDNCWQPYVTLGYVHNFMGKTHYRADGIALPGMSIDPYVEYSIGVQKTWNDTYTVFGQATGRNGGRNGFEISIGLRCAW